MSCHSYRIWLIERVYDMDYFEYIEYLMDTGICEDVAREEAAAYFEESDDSDF